MTHSVPEAHAGGPQKRVLVVSYSQTGQLTAILERILAPLRQDPRIALHVEVLHPQPAFPFPWPFLPFFDAFPESAHMVPPALAPLSLRGDEDFDLILLPYQVWFLAPSQPITAFLKHPVAARLLHDKPVITVIGCRNMWMLAQEKMRGMLLHLGAHLIDNVVLTDRASTLATLLTTPLWLFTGKRQCLRWLPPAGIAEEDIARCTRFGRALGDALAANLEQARTPLLQGLQAVEADPRLLVSEKAGTRSFYLWGALLRWAGPPGARIRRPLLLLYILFLLAIILSVVPISLAIQTLFRPLMQRRLMQLKQHFEHPSGSGTDRLSHYDF